MHRILFLLFLTIISLSIYAQEKGVVKEATPQADSVTIKDSVVETSKEQVVIDAMSSTVNDLNGKIITLQAEIKRLKGDSISKSDTISQLRKALDSRTLKIQNETKRAEAAISEQKRVKNILSNVDAIVYKQCLLYPLEAKYDSITRAEALQAVNAFSEINSTPSGKFVEYKNIYYDLLYQYPTYYDQILSFLKKGKTVLGMTNWIVGVHKEKFLNDMKSLPYWKFYLHRNEPPYKSILYLDNVLDKFKEIVNRNGNVKNEIEDLINKVSPSSK